MEGDEGFRSLKKEGINISFIFLSFKIQDKEKKEYFELGAFAFL
jgi:hypothetical protein